MKNFYVFRSGKCMECGQLTEIQIGCEIEAKTPEEAIEKAQEEWNRENFGQAGALRENDKLKEELFLQGDFKAEEVK